MFKMYDKFTEEEFVVYKVRDDRSGYPQFLVRLNGVCLYRSAKHFNPTKRQRCMITHLIKIGGLL